MATSTRVTILDLPGWRAGRPRSCPPTVDGIARAATDWLDAAGRHDVILVGHSTGANAARRAALLDARRLTGLVLAAPTFDPPARRTRTLVGRMPATLGRESIAELPAVLPEYLASGGYGVGRLIKSAMQDRPEDEVGRLSIPTVVITGQHDGFAPPRWAHRLAELATAPCIVLPGAHNWCFTHPDQADAALRRLFTEWASRRS
jgi:pimeloyl-ACP methyl ester carboxylesterase